MATDLYKKERELEKGIKEKEKELEEVRHQQTRRHIEMQNKQRTKDEAQWEEIRKDEVTLEDALVGIELTVESIETYAGLESHERKWGIKEEILKRRRSYHTTLHVTDYNGLERVEFPGGYPVGITEGDEITAYVLPVESKYIRSLPEIKGTSRSEKIWILRDLKSTEIAVKIEKVLDDAGTKSTHWSSYVPQHN